MFGNKFGGMFASALAVATFLAVHVTAKQKMPICSGVALGSIDFEYRNSYHIIKRMHDFKNSSETYEMDLPQVCGGVPNIVRHGFIVRACDTDFVPLISTNDARSHYSIVRHKGQNMTLPAYVEVEAHCQVLNPMPIPTEESETTTDHNVS